jgi:hypothetical protein
LKVATNIQENAEDIYAEAQQINEERALEDVIETEDVSAEESSTEESATEETKADIVE